MKKLVWLGILVGAFYAHAHFMFSGRYIANWMVAHDKLAMHGKDKACDGFTYDLKTNIRVHHATGQWEVDSGTKDMMCEFLKRSTAAIMLSNATVNTERTLISIDRSKFPWMSATVKVNERHRVKMKGLPAMEETVEATYVFRRGIRTVQISSIDSVSRGNFIR